jgi:lipoprotein-releasing system permease protein
VNIINFFTFLVIVIGSAALFIVLSAFAGLKTFSLQFTNTFDPDVKAVPLTGKFFSISKKQMESLDELDGVASYSAEIVERVYLSFKEKNHIAYIKGVDDNYRKVTGVDSTLYFGNWGVDEDQAVVGMGIFNLLGGPLGNRSPLTAITLKPGERSITSDALSSNSFYNQMPLVVSGVYAVEDGLDKKYVFAPLKTTQAFLEKGPEQFSGINFKLKEGLDISKVKEAIRTALGNNVLVLTRQELNGTLHKMLKTENTATYLIFTLVLVIALFNVVGAIIMLILDKRENSKTLYALGTTIKQLRKIYFLQGVLVTVVGGLAGIILGSFIVLSQLAFEWWKITPSLAYPVEYQWVNNLIVLGTIVILGLISSKIASSRISKKLLAN